MSPAPKAARAEIDALAAEVESLGSELAGLQELHRKHEAAAKKAARDHRAGNASADELQAATSAEAAVKYALDATRDDLVTARAALEAAEHAAADELVIAEVAAATVEYHAAEQAHRELFAETERTIAAAIARSDELKNAASTAKSRAHDAAHKLATKRAQDAARALSKDGNTELDDVLALAVVGSEVAPMRHSAAITKWPYGIRQRWRLLAQIQPKTQGVSFGEEAGA